MAQSSTLTRDSSGMFSAAGSDSMVPVTDTRAANPLSAGGRSLDMGDSSGSQMGDPYRTFNTNVADILSQIQKQATQGRANLGGAKDTLTTESVGAAGGYNPEATPDTNIAHESGLMGAFQPAVTSVNTQLENTNKGIEDLTNYAEKQQEIYKPQVVSPGQSEVTPGGNTVFQGHVYTPMVNPNTGYMDSYDTATGTWASGDHAAANGSTGGTTPPESIGAAADLSLENIFGKSNKMGAYATDPNYISEVSGLYKTIASLGVAGSPDTLQQYIKNNAGNAPVTGQMLLNAASTYGIDPALLTTIALHESDFGTKGAAVNTNNPFNIGNTGTSTKTYNSVQQGVLAGAKNIADRMKAGANPVQNASPNNAAHVIDPRGNPYSAAYAGRVGQLPQPLQKFVLAGPGGAAYIDADAAKSAGLDITATNFGAKAGVPVMSSADVKGIDAMNDVAIADMQMKQLVAKNLGSGSTPEGGLPSVFNHISNTIANTTNTLTQNSPDLAEFNAYIGNVVTAAATIKSLVGGQGSGVRITGFEVGKIQDTFPQAGDSWQTAQKKMEAFDKKVSAWMHTNFPDVPADKTVYPAGYIRVKIGNQTGAIPVSDFNSKTMTPV